MESAVRLDRDPNPVRQLEVRLLARVLHQPYHVSCPAFRDELIGEIHVERYHAAPGVETAGGDPARRLESHFVLTLFQHDAGDLDAAIVEHEPVARTLRAENLLHFCSVDLSERRIHLDLARAKFAYVGRE